MDGGSSPQRVEVRFRRIVSDKPQHGSAVPSVRPAGSVPLDLLGSAALAPAAGRVWVGEESDVTGSDCIITAQMVLYYYCTVDFCTEPYRTVSVRALKYTLLLYLRRNFTYLYFT